MQPFIPPVVRRNLQPRNSRRHVLHLRNLLLIREPRRQIVDPLVDRERGIEVGRSGAGGLREPERRKKNEDQEQELERFHRGNCGKGQEQKQEPPGLFRGCRLRRRALQSI
jgi:hypothetical protein